MVPDLAAFFAVSVLVIVTPGPDTALTIKNALGGGRRGGVATAAGVASGQACWTVAASAGIAALLVTSEPVFRAVRVAGAAYLVFLGLQALRDALRSRTRRGRAGAAGRALRCGVAFRQGFISNLGNPKMAVFFTSLLPQFGNSFAAVLALGLLFCVMTLIWLSAYAVAVARAGDVLRRPAVRRIVDAVTGAVLVAFGIRLATERR